MGMVETIANGRNGGTGGNNGCSYRTFLACNPQDYDGKGGVCAYERGLPNHVLNGVVAKIKWGTSMRVVYSLALLMLVYPNYILLRTTCLLACLLAGSAVILMRLFVLLLWKYCTTAALDLGGQLDYLFDKAVSVFNAEMEIEFETYGISAGKEVDIGLSGGRDKPLRPAHMLLYSWDEGLDVCVDLTGSSPLTQTGMINFALGQTVIEAAQRKRVKHEAKCVDIGYGFLPFSFSSFAELEKDVLLKSSNIELGGLGLHLDTKNREYSSTVTEYDYDQLVMDVDQGFIYDISADVDTVVGSPLNNEDVVNISLKGLPTKYDNVYGIIVHWEPFPDLKKVRSRLTTEEMRLKSQAQDTFIDSTSSSPMVLLANSGTNARRSTPSTKKVNKPCFNFNKGSRRFGEQCKFLHNRVHGNPSLWSNSAPRSPITSSPNLTQTDIVTLQTLLSKLGYNRTSTSTQFVGNSSVQNNTRNNAPMALHTTPHGPSPTYVSFHNPSGFNSPQQA
ncbi:hybrid signal transduction histidine kinase M [Tanacetum coccineum]